MTDTALETPAAETSTDEPGDDDDEDDEDDEQDADGAAQALDGGGDVAEEPKPEDPGNAPL